MGLFSHSKDNGRDIVKKIEKLKHHIIKTKDPQKEYTVFTKIINKFFEEKYNVHYKFTYEDLKYELLELIPEDQKEIISNFCDSLNELEFDKEKISSKNLMELSDKFLEVSHLPIVKIQEYLPNGEKKIDMNAFSDDMFAPPDFAPPDFEPEQKIEEVKEPEPVKEIFKKEKIIEEKPKTISKKPVIKQEKEVERIDFKEEDILKIPEPLKIDIPEPITQKDKEILSFDAVDADLPIPPPPQKEEEEKLVKEIKQKPIEKERNLKKSKKIKLLKKIIPKIKKTKTIKPKKLETLPTFNINKEPLKQDLEEILKNLKTNKKEIQKEILLINKEQKLLEKEKKLVKSKTKTKVLPSFKIFNKQKEDEIRELEHKKQILLKKEELIDSKLIELRKIEKQLTQFSKNLKQDDKSVKKQKEYVKSKETIIKKIKKDIEKNYEKALKEIEAMRVDLKEKEEQFLGLQQFFIKRENKLSVEEENLLNEKRRYGKAVSNLVNKHLELAKQDLEHTSMKVESLKDEIKKADKTIAEYEPKYEEIETLKQELVSDLKQKKEYFTKAEQDFRSRDDEFEALEEDISNREEKLAKLESQLNEFEKTIDESNALVRKRRHDVDVKEVEIKSLERDIERLKFDIKNQEIRIDIKQKQFEKRNNSYVRIKKEIQKSISREKQAIKRISKRLTSKGHYVDHKIKETEKIEDVYDGSLKAARQLDLPGYNNENDLMLKEITITHEFPENEIGDPNVLDILRLINKAKLFIKANQKQQSRDCYLEIQRLFDELNEIDREELYPQITEVFKTRPGITTNVTNGYGNKNIDMLIQDFENSIVQGNMQASSNIYNALQVKYETLPKTDKPKYFGRIITLYNKISAV